ncbi:hypothetical protein BZA77DRAFT_360749 [Pyronema omphalodes]|nr:hypothetical protein BZA77DRAFT_360749 [Pyronema omphalodes]
MRTTAAPASADHKKGFSFLGSIMRKSKAVEAPPPSGPPKLELNLSLGPPTPPSKVDTPPPPPPQQQTKLTKKRSSDVDDELRKHLQREGFAFLSYGEEVQPETSKVVAVADPVASARRDGTLLRDAVQRLSMEASRAPVKAEVRPLSPVPKVQSLLDVPPQVPEKPQRVPSIKRTPSVKKPEQPPATLKKNPPSRTPSRPELREQDQFVTAPMVPIVEKREPQQLPQERPREQPREVPREQPREQPQESMMDRKIRRKTSDKSQDSGKDVNNTPEIRLENMQTGRSSAPPETMKLESSNMARFAQDTSMQDVDPRRQVRNSASYQNHARRPPADKRHTSQINSNASHSRTPGHSRTPSHEGLRRQENTTPMSLPLRSSPEEEKSEGSSEASFKLPIPIMPSPNVEYKFAPNDLQRACEINHRTTQVTPNVHHSIICMVCQSDSPDRRFMCTYCALRFCTRCKTEFSLGSKIEDIMDKAESKEWKSQSSGPPTPTREAPARNIPWELACIMEAGGRLMGPRIRAPPPGRYPPPQRRYTSDRSSPNSSSPDERLPLCYKPPSPVSAESRNSSRNSIREQPHEEQQYEKRPVMKASRNSSMRCAPNVMTATTPAEQRRALLGSY